MAKGIIVDRIKRFGPSKIVEICDVDLTFCNTMATNTTDAQKAAMLELYLRTAGGVVFSTGRSSAGVDATFSGQLPGSFEHHAAMRIEQGGDIIALAPRIDTHQLARYAETSINGHINIAKTPDEVRQAEGHFSCVYPEVKNFALALVHSLGHSAVDADRVIIEQAAQYAIDQAGLGSVCKIAKGSDAIEIVPKGLDETSLASQFLNAQQIGYLRDALNKASAVHNFMSLPEFKDRIPNFWGDSGTDGKGMIVAAEHYGGTGTWVKNGKSVPEEFAAAVGDRTIENYFRTWDEIEAANQYLRDHTRIVVLPRSKMAPS